MIHTLIVSDLHLGTPISQKEKILETLSLDFENLVINGDLFDNHCFHRYKKDDWKILNKIRKLTKHKNVVLVEGNHDMNGEFLAAITGMDFVKQHVFKIRDLKFICIHGDKYDNWMKKHPKTTEFFSGAYYYLQRLQKDQTFAGKLKKISKKWIQSQGTIQDKFLHEHGGHYDVLLAGHTHAPENSYSEKHDCWYLNSGSFCEPLCSYVAVYSDGNFELCFL